MNAAEIIVLEKLHEAAKLLTDASFLVSKEGLADSLRPFFEHTEYLAARTRATAISLEVALDSRHRMTML